MGDIEQLTEARKQALQLAIGFTDRVAAAELFSGFLMDAHGGLAFEALLTSVAEFDIRCEDENAVVERAKHYLDFLLGRRVTNGHP